MLVNFYLNQNIIYNNLLLKKVFSKYVYTKFLILTTFAISKRKSVLLLDNYFTEFSFKLKKKIKRLGFLFKIKAGKFLKSSLFIYRHSKFKFIYFFSIRFKTYIKKNIYLSLSKLQNTLQNLNLVYIYKNIRGGFLGFSNNILGFLPKKYFLDLRYILKKTINLLIYKKYFILLNVLNCLPYNLTHFSTFLFYKAGYIRNFRTLKKKNSLRRFFFKRFKFIFTSNSLIFKKKLLYFKKNFTIFLKYKSITLFIYIFLYFYSLLALKI